MTDGTRHYIGGRWTESHGADSVEVENPATEGVIASVRIGDAEDVDRAVGAASDALPAWSATTAEERAVLLEAIASAVEQRADELASTLTQELGVPVSMARPAQVGMALQIFRQHADIAREFVFEEKRDGYRLVREPAGVVAAVTPWNFPLFQIACKVAPALTAGCTVVLKPSELTPLNALLLADILEQAGVPAGVVNVVTGDGIRTGEALVSHPDVAVVSFTGSTRAGTRVSQVAADTVKKVVLELGGKSASLVFADADIEAAVQRTVASAFQNSGQVCAALTRLVVERSRLGEVLELAVAAGGRFVPGDPQDPATLLGPVASRTQLDRIRGLVETAGREGARVVLGGTEPPSGLARGHYVRPTILADVHPDSTVAQEEVFGPVLGVIPFDDEKEAVRIANNSKYGLSGAVWSGDQERAERVARKIKTGMVVVNGAAGTMRVPFGGVKQSGHGREWGDAGVEEFLDAKSLVIQP
ncbi:aldehyde dehydrogenase family protein [Streptomyces sp. NPDC002680]|uniref:aldehyde dehydrogenase family protein n=1 Tax=Streptomyces sp. NPDC002680 TaxID=3364659 RepID=UPI003686796B